jgi:hypothetical protein
MKVPDMSEDLLEMMLYWIQERECVHKLKELGTPLDEAVKLGARYPWSKDPIFQHNRFCNIERERDATTVWVREHWRDPHRDNPHVWFLMVVARMINWSPTLGAITLPLPWDRDRFVAEMAERKAQKLKLFNTPAYRPYIPSDGRTLHLGLADDILSPLWAARERVRPRASDTCRSFFERLRTFKYISDFRAGQFVADTKFTPPLLEAPDWWTFVASGPGSGKWLNVMRGGLGERPLKGRDFAETFAHLRAKITPRLDELGLKLSNSDLQNCCCESFKYWRESPASKQALPSNLEISNPITEDERALILAAKCPPSGSQPATAGELFNPGKEIPMNTPKLHAVDDTGDNGIAPVTVGNPKAASALAIDQSHLEEFVAAGSESSVIECRRPAKAQFFTVWPETSTPWKNRQFYFLLQMEGRDPYIVDPEIARQKQEEEDTIRPILIVRYVTMTGDEGLWPVKLNPSDGKSNQWNTSARNILDIADSGKWVRIVSLKNHYRHQVSKKTFNEVPPRFSDRSFDELVNMAFPKDRVVTTLEHEIWEALKNGSTK